MLFSSPVSRSAGNDSRRQEPLALQWNGVEGKRHREVDSRDSGIYDGVSPGVDIYNPHRGSLDKHRFPTMGYKVSELRASYIFTPTLHIFELRKYFFRDSA